MSFALNNIMLRHQAERTAQARLFAMFVGGIVAPSAVAALLAVTAQRNQPSPMGVIVAVEITDIAAHGPGVEERGCAKQRRGQRAHQPHDGGGELWIQEISLLGIGSLRNLLADGLLKQPSSRTGGGKKGG